MENQRQLFGIKLKTGELDTSDALIRQRTFGVERGARSSCGWSGGANGFVKKPRGVGQDWLVVVFVFPVGTKEDGHLVRYIYIYFFF